MLITNHSLPGVLSGVRRYPERKCCTSSGAVWVIIGQDGGDTRHTHGLVNREKKFTLGFFIIR